MALVQARTVPVVERLRHASLSGLPLSERARHRLSNRNSAFQRQRRLVDEVVVFRASALAVVASVLLTAGLYFMKRQAERLPSLKGGWHPVAWWAFVRDGWWLFGLGLQIVGYGLYLTALRSAPLSVISVSLNGGIGLFVVLSALGLGEFPRAIEWLGVVLLMGSLIILDASLSSTSAAESGIHGILPFSITVLGLAVLALSVDPSPRRPLGISTASGLLLGLGAVYAKELAAGGGSSAGLATYLVLTLLANAVGFALMQAALQSGRGVVVMPLFSALSNLVPIVGGILVFGEAIPGEGAAATLRPLAFALTVLGAALLAGFGEQLPQPQADSNPLRR